MPSCDTRDPDRCRWGAVVHAPREPVDYGRYLGNMVAMVEMNR